MFKSIETCNASFCQLANVNLARNLLINFFLKKISKFLHKIYIVKSVLF